jgi:hypothetical protein
MTYSSLFKVWATVLAAILAAILLTTAAFATGAGAQEQPPCSGKVVLDAGHRLWMSQTGSKPSSQVTAARCT